MVQALRTLMRAAHTMLEVQYREAVTHTKLRYMEVPGPSAPMPLERRLPSSVPHTLYPILHPTPYYSVLYSTLHTLVPFLPRG